ncbi:hypothetical protein [Undibacterium sp. TS12]|uniref:hypothetical protein n=1 Tax=Undibacterium sp. TS12 TaxID=2908202 RepID=UPI001F4CA9DC|nr:hypothetical protein [Undibacterium sp. TS12]MCH8623015.1 hypothetical protein [Undibacterium sp. TS12]
MGNFFHFIIATMLCTMLSGCYVKTPPMKSASLTYLKTDKLVGLPQDIKPEQLDKLSQWLQSHRWGWQPVVAPYFVDAILTIRNTDGSISTFKLMKNLVIVGQYELGISAEEYKELYSMIVLQNDSK